MTVTRDQLTRYLNGLLNPTCFSDYGPNGLQIQGKDNIKTVAFAVSATKKSIAQAIAKKADALVVHHGLFWKFHGSRTLTGTFAQRVIPLVKAEINLYGYHLPLDAHIEFGNAAQLAKKMGLQNLEAFGDYKGSPIGVKGSFPEAIKASELKSQLEVILEHNVMHACENPDEQISTMGIITGGANSEWRLASEQGLHSYLTGEMSEHDWHESAEAGIHMFAGGHNATEQFGIQAVMEQLKKEYCDLETFFISSENPA